MKSEDFYVPEFEPLEDWVGAGVDEDPEDGLEAPLRRALRPVYAEWLQERDPATRPDPWELVSEGDKQTEATRVRLEQQRQDRQRQLAYDKAKRSRESYLQNLARRDRAV